MIIYKKKYTFRNEKIQPFCILYCIIIIMKWILILIFLFSFPVYSKYSEEIERILKKEKVEEFVFTVGDIYRTSCLVKRIIEVESNYSEKAKRYEENVRDYSYGLMQVRCDTAKSMGFKGECSLLLDPVINLKYGIRYFKRKLKRYEDLTKAIAAYNAGSPIVCKRGINCEIGKYINQLYVDKLLSEVFRCKIK